MIGVRSLRQRAKETANGLLQKHQKTDHYIGIFAALTSFRLNLTTAAV